MNLTNKIAFREVLGGWRGLIVFYLCVIISSIVLISIDQFSTNLKYHFQTKAKEILGGDVEITLSNIPLEDKMIQQLSKYGEISKVIELRGMLRVNDESTLVEIKAVDESYPLIGELDFNAEKLFVEDYIYVASDLYSNAEIRESDAVEIGYATYKIAGAIGQEPDWLASSFVIGPRVLISENNLKKSGLLSPGSLIKYKYRIKLSSENLAVNLKEVIKNDFESTSWVVRNFEDGNQSFNNSVDRFEFFLILAGISNLLICGVGIATATKYFMDGKLINIAILKSCGATSRDIITTYLKLILLAGLDAYLFAVVISIGILNFLLPSLNEYLPFQIEFRNFVLPYFKALAFVLLTIVTFGLPVILNASDAKPASLFRGAIILEFKYSIRRNVIYLISTLALSCLIIIYSDDVKFFVGYLLGVFITFFIYLMLGKFIKRFISKIRLANFYQNLAIRNMLGSGISLTIALLSIGISLTIFVVLTTAQYNLHKKLNENIPLNAPSLFLIDVFEEQIKPLSELALNYGDNLIIKPNIQGMLTHVNSIPIAQLNVDKGSQWAVSSHRRLSYAGQIPNNTELSEGKWWVEENAGEALVSMDKNIGIGISAKIGDEITFSILGEDIVAKVANFRDVDYSSFNINFAIIFSEGVLEKFPKSYFVTLKVNDEKAENIIVKKLSKQFPNVVTIRISEGLKIAKKYIDDIVYAIGVIVVISIISGVLVLASSFLSQQQKRKHDIVILKVLGADFKIILKSLLIEASLLGFAASIVAILLGNIGAYLILKYIRFTDILFSLELNLATLLFAIFIVFVVLIISTWKTLNSQSVDILRNE